MSVAAVWVVVGVGEIAWPVVGARAAARSFSTATAMASEVLVADDLAELALGFEHPGCGPA